MRVTVPSPLFATQTAPSPTATPAGDRPTGIVVVTARVAGSMRTTALSSVSATQTPSAPTAMPLGPWPTAIGVRRPVGSMRVTVFASPPVTQTAPALASTATPAGPAFGSILLTTRPLPGSSRESRPEEGATQTVRPAAATDPGPPMTTLPIGVRAETVLKSGSMRLTVTDALVAFEPTTQTAAGDVASPVGVSSTATVRSMVRVSGSIRATVWSSRFATQSDPDP